jgi:hypothetical protein
MNYRNGAAAAADRSPPNDLAQKTMHKSFAADVPMQRSVHLASGESLLAIVEENAD